MEGIAFGTNCSKHPIFFWLKSHSSHCVAQFRLGEPITLMSPIRFVIQNGYLSSPPIELKADRRYRKDLRRGKGHSCAPFGTVIK